MKNDNIHRFFSLFWLQLLNLPASLQTKNTRIGPFPWKRSVLQNPDRERTNQSTGIYLRLGLPYNKCILLTKREVKMAGYWPSSLFAFLWDRDEVEVHKNAKRERGQYPAILTELAWSIKDLLYGIPRLHVALCFYFCVCRFLLQNVFLKLMNIFCFLCFILVDAFGFLVF